MRRYLYTSTLCIILFATLLSIPTAFAKTQTFEVLYLPLSEAKDAIQTQLSATGSVTSLASRRLLIVNDDQHHLQAAKKLLKQLDVPSMQYMLTLNIIQLNEQQLHHLASNISLTHGWLKLTSNYKQASSHKTFSLRVYGSRQSSIEFGESQPRHHHIRQWLASYHLIEQDSVELVSLTSGFNIRVQPTAHKHVHIHIQPWLHNTHLETSLQGQSELLFSLGTSTNPQQPKTTPGDLRLNTNPMQSPQARIDIASAETELDIPLDKDVTILAYNHDAKMLGRMVLDTHSKTAYLAVQLHLTKLNP